MAPAAAEASDRENESVRRKFERDKNELRSLDIAVDAAAGAPRERDGGADILRAARQLGLDPVPSQLI